MFSINQYNQVYSPTYIKEYYQETLTNYIGITQSKYKKLTTISIYLYANLNNILL